MGKFAHSNNVPISSNWIAMMSISYRNISITALCYRRNDLNGTKWEIVPQKPTRSGLDFQEQGSLLVKDLETNLGPKLLSASLTEEKISIVIDPHIQTWEFRNILKKGCQQGNQKIA